MPLGLNVHVGARMVRSAAFRLAVIQALMFALMALTLFLVSWFAARHYIENQLRQTIIDEFGEVIAHPPAQRAASIQRSLAQVPRGAYDYSLFDARRTLVVGDIREEPAVGWSTIEQHEGLRSGKDAVRRILVYGAAQDDGSTLVVGRDLASVDELDALLKRVFTWAGLAAVVLALAGGMVTARGYLRRVEAIAAAASRIAAGDLAARVSITGRGDEFDRLAVSLNSMLERIQTLVEGLRQVSNDIAHDLRTPLTHMRQRLEAAMDEATSLEGYSNACERALADVDSVLDTFAAMLRIAKVESRQQREGFTDIDLSQLLARLVDDYGPVLEDEERVLSAEIQPSVNVRGDALLLTQMFVNLLENALHHTPIGTPVTLKLVAAEQGCQVVMQDAGPGIPAQERTRVLKRFVRLDASRSTRGSGLGLALVAAVADLHDIVLTLGDAGPGLRVQLDFPHRQDA
ncbi:sensor histidine kinase [Dyella acidisoli]|uniref:histidine kinase n=1 Tax=Dyella acidisoli TaxID=1867834 RepID=A0ABQ5XV91_9GAMM|nr:ATP-binding protein [Dyella acidisoli]GLQ94974.1 two-component sensor histidine kinase [Dyella acidisoli]